MRTSDDALVALLDELVVLSDPAAHPARWRCWNGRVRAGPRVPACGPAPAKGRQPPWRGLLRTELCETAGGRTVVVVTFRPRRVG